MQNGTLKNKVHGVNIPSLLESLSEWVTPLPGLDDLEVGSLWCLCVCWVTHICVG